MLVVSLSGVFIGLAMGLTGAGGGILAVPALVILLDLSMTEAAPIALMAVGISAIVGALDGLNKKLVRYKAALFMAASGAIFSHLGVRLAHIIPDAVLMTLFSALMLLIAFRMARHGVLPPAASASPRKPCMLNPLTGRLSWTGRCAAALAAIGSATGLLAGMLGVGGGFVMVPALKRCSDIGMHGIVATSLMVIALISLSTVAGILLQGARIPATGWLFVGAAVLGMVLGRLAAPHVSAQRLQTAFSMIAGLVAVILLIRTYVPGMPG